MTSDRSDSRFPIDCCLDYFGLPDSAYEAIKGLAGRDLLSRLWAEQGERMYQAPIYLLRQEWFHVTMARNIDPFFLALPPDAVLYDFGCGTAEAERRLWIDQGRKTVLEDLAGPLAGYLRAKYPQETVTIGGQDAPFDALLCLDVLEHLRDPIPTWLRLWERLPVGGMFLAWFDPGFPHPGHLPSAIRQRDVWLRHVESHAQILGHPACAIWGTKLT